jgi:hypothetical protein
LVNEIVPRLKSSISTSVRPVGCEDLAELVQDGTAFAAKMLHGAEAQGKQVSAGKIAYYTVQHLKSGRRSTGCHKADPLHAAAQLSGRSRMHSLDESVAGEEGSEETLTLGEILASRADDPAMEASRRLDWSQLVAKLDRVTRTILRALANGQELTLLVPGLGRSRSTLQTHKQRLARLVREYLGEDILRQVQALPGWQDGVHASREKAACRWERQVA